jgi:hypothetical protein
VASRMVLEKCFDVGLTAEKKKKAKEASLTS